MRNLRKIKILIVVPNLSAGGAEKVMSFIAQNLNTNIFEPILLIIGFKKDDVYDTQNVKTIYLNKNKVRNSFFSLLLVVKKEKPNIIFSSLSHLNTTLGLLSYLFPKIHFIGRETYVKGAQFSTRLATTRGFLFSLISNIGYNGLKYIICQSEDMKIDMVKNQGAQEKKIVVINNPISKNFCTKDQIPSIEKGYKFITVGRLAKHKGFDRILNTLSKIDHPFNYLIIGEGPEKNNIIELIETLNLKDKVEHISFTTNICDYLSASHFYLQGSHVEGFPNALIESLAVGTPAIVFDAPGGINEIMIDGENGSVVNSEKEFELKLNENIHQINKFSPKKVSRHVRREYIAEKIITKYESFFQSLVKN